MTFRRENRLYKLSLVQQPKHSRMCGFGEKVDRRPVDPPPVVKLEVIDSSEDAPLCNPYYFMYATLMSATSNVELHMLRDAKTRSTTGSSVSSLYRLKDNFNKAGFFFVFPDLSIRMEGTYRLKFSLFEIIDTDIYYCDSICSDPFDVFTAKKFPGMEESTPLSRIFAEQGLKIRIRKDSRAKKYRSDDFTSKRSRDGDTDGSNSDVSDDNSERGSSHKRSKKIFAGKFEDGRYAQESSIASSSKGPSPPMPYGFYPPEAYQSMRTPYPPYGFQRPIYGRDKSHIHSRREHGPTSSVENMQRHPYPMNLQAYPMMYVRYPYDPYAPRHYDPNMMARPYTSGYHVQGYSVRKLSSNSSENVSPAEDTSLSVIKPEQDSSAIKVSTHVNTSQDVVKNTPPYMSDPNALRSFYEPSSAHAKSNASSVGASHEYGSSYVYCYPPGAFGYPPGGDVAHGKRSYAYPVQYTYPAPVNQAAQGISHGNAPPGGYYGPQYPGMYLPGPYIPPGLAPYPHPTHSSMSPGPNSSATEPPQNVSLPHSHAYPAFNNSYPGHGAHPFGNMYAHGAYPTNFGGPQKRHSLPMHDNSRSNSVSSAPSGNGRNSPPLQNKPLGPVEFSNPSTSNVDQHTERQQSLYSRPPYPQFVSSQIGIVNLPPLNIATSKTGLPQNENDLSSGSPVSPPVEPKREPVEITRD